MLVGFVTASLDLITCLMITSNLSASEELDSSLQRAYVMIEANLAIPM